MSCEDRFSHGYALLIGVGHYKENLLSVPATAQDAQDLGRILTSPKYCAYPENQVVVLVNENANKARILTELDTLRARTEADGNSTAVIFFSGHGWQQDGYYFLPYETKTFSAGGQPHVKLSTALANEDFLNKVRQIPAQRLVILFNTCFAGAVGTALSPKIEQLPQFAPVPLGLYDELLKGTGRVIISSSQGEERSWVKGGATNSLFVTHLLSALQGHGIQTSDKAIRVIDLFTYLDKTVPADANTIGKVQTPVLKAYDATNFPIALLLGGEGLSPHSGKEPSMPLPCEPDSSAIELDHASFEQKSVLADALLACPTMSDRSTRDAVVDDLPDDIKNAIRRNSVDRVDVSNIVARCLVYPGGIKKLVEILRFYEGNSTGMQKVEQLVEGSKKLSQNT